MDDINVGDRRRSKNSDDDHIVVGVADFAVQIRRNYGTVDVETRPWYDHNTEPVPAAPTFERGDVVMCRDVAYVVHHVDSAVRLIDPDGLRLSATRDMLTPAGHKVATIDENRWWVVWSNGGMRPMADREHAEREVEYFHHAHTIATVRDGRIVEPYVDDDGVEHLVGCDSEPRS